MNNFELGTDIGDFLDNIASLLQIEVEKYTKHYEKIDNKWSLYAVTDTNGIVTELTPIPDYKTTYVDLKNGRIWNDLRDDFSKANTPNYYGYIYSSFEGNPVSIHSLIMQAATQQKPNQWVNEFGEKLEVDHRNGIKHDNKISNLRLVTRKQQFDERVRQKMSDNAGTPLTKEEVQYIRYFTAIVKAKGEKVDSKLIHLLANKFDKQYETIRKVVNGVTHRDVELPEAMKQEVRKIELQHDLARLGIAV